MRHGHQRSINPSARQVAKLWPNIIAYHDLDIILCIEYIYTIEMKTVSTSFQIGPLSQAAPGPLYQQIVDGVRREISAGRLGPECSLPSFRVLAEELRVSLITVKRAYEELEREGIIYRRQGLGTFAPTKVGSEAGRPSVRRPGPC